MTTCQTCRNVGCPLHGKAVPISAQPLSCEGYR